MYDGTSFVQLVSESKANLREFSFGAKINIIMFAHAVTTHNQFHFLPLFQVVKNDASKISGGKEW
jgi:hypothetical protein